MPPANCLRQCGERGGVSAGKACSDTELQAQGLTLDRLEWQRACAEWLRKKRHHATLVVMLFLASVRATMDGKSYLRSHLLGVMLRGTACCSVIAGVCRATCVYGAGCPLGLFMLLCQTPTVRLLSPEFEATSGFLYVGYSTSNIVVASNGACARCTSSPSLVLWEALCCSARRAWCA